MKSVLMSIKPEWCELIANGKKTVEVRKTRPKLDTPFKCYIYCTDSKDMLWILRKNERYFKNIALVFSAKNVGGATKANGKVIGEFVCNKMLESFLNNNDGWFVEKGCLTQKEIDEYQGDKAVLYGWHISDLVIYDTPKELSEFKKAGFLTEGEWLACLYPNTHCHYEAWAKKFNITRPPQSWCYVEELK